MYYLTVKCGASKGKTWPITEKPLVIGRGDHCDVCIEDPTVSRQHCEVLTEFREVKLKDLGSRNAPLLNGVPTVEGVLAPGDELSVGPITFVIAAVSADRENVHSKENDETTCVLDLNKSIFLREASALPNHRSAPATISELHGVFQLGLRLASTHTSVELLNAFEGFVYERLTPKAFWLATFIEGEDKLVLCPSDHGPCEDIPEEAMRESMRRTAGLLRLRRRRRGNGFAVETVLVCPIVNAGRTLGAVAIARTTPASVYDESDLEYFVAVAQTLAPHLEAITARDQLRRDYDYARTHDGAVSTLVGNSPQMVRVREQIAHAATARLNVLLLGETGTGKDVAARLIHDSSARAQHPFVVVNCPAIPRELFESEMFGHERGAYTGAQARKSGLIEEAHGGTLFLDEVGDLSLENQARLLRVAETGAFYRAGSTKEIHVDVRIIAATNRLTGPPGADSQFRRDLYYRLSNIEIHMPPLRERLEDVPELAHYFIERARHAGHPATGIGPGALKRLQSWQWPGNVRELRSCVLRAATLAQADTIGTNHLHFPDAQIEKDAIDTGLLALSEVEKRHIQSVLRKSGGNVRATARTLEISRATLYKKIEAYGIQF